MARPYNKNIPVETEQKAYGIQESLDWIAKKIGPRTRQWLYVNMRSKGIAPRKNGKMSYLYEYDLSILTKISTLPELIHNHS